MKYYPAKKNRIPASSKNDRLLRITIPIVFIAALAVTAYMRNIVWSGDISLWSDVILKSPMKSRGYANLGNAYRAAKRIREAIEMNERAIALGQNPVAYNSLAHIYMDLGRPDKAIDLLSRLILSNPAWAKAYNNRGVVYYKTGRYGEAIADYTRALALSPDFGEAHVNLGNVYDETGQPQRAVEEYTAAIRINPVYAAAFFNRGITLVGLGRSSESRADFDRACFLGSREACENLRLQGKSASPRP